MVFGTEDGFWFALKRELDGSCFYEFYCIADCLEEGTAASAEAAIALFDEWRKKQLH